MIALDERSTYYADIASELSLERLEILVISNSLLFSTFQTECKARKLSQSVPSTTITGPHSTILAHENILRQIMVAELALQTPSITPSPLRVPVMLTTDILMLSKIIDYSVKSILAICNIGMSWNFLIDRLICHGNKSVLMPMRAVA